MRGEKATEWTDEAQGMELPFYREYESDGGDGKKFATFKVQNAFMSPTIQKGDVVVIDLADNKAHPGGDIYVARIAGTIGLARCMWTPYGISVTGDNPHCEKVTWPYGDIQIIGKVIWYCRDLRR